MPTRTKKKSEPATPPVGKLDAMIASLRGEAGASIAALMAITGWRQHSVRGALAGAVKKKGFAVTSEKADGVRVYRITAERKA